MPRGAGAAERAEMSTGAAVRGIALQIETDRTARRQSRPAGTRTKGANETRAARLVAAPAMLRAGREIDAASATGRETGAAILDALPRRAHLEGAARKSTLPAVSRVRSDVDANTGAIAEPRRTPAGPALARGAGGANGIAPAAVFRVHLEVDTRTAIVAAIWTLTRAVPAARSWSADAATGAAMQIAVVRVFARTFTALEHLRARGPVRAGAVDPRPVVSAVGFHRIRGARVVRNVPGPIAFAKTRIIGMRAAHVRKAAVAPGTRRVGFLGRSAGAENERRSQREHETKKQRRPHSPQ